MMNNLVVSIFFASCFSLAAFGQSDSLNSIKLMQLEKATVDQFTSMREFHLGLREEVGTMEGVPYFRLDSLFLALKNHADSAIITRSKYEAEKLKLSMQEKDVLYVLTERKMSDYKASAKSASNYYQSVCAGFKVLRIDKYGLMQKVGKYTHDMQDSLEVQGKLIADAKIDLAKRFPDKQSKEYLSAYTPISEMQAIHKKFEGNIVQLENLYSRIEESNGGLYYYYGPMLQPRQEVAAADQILTTCFLQMKEIRDWNSKYWLSQKQK
ncbi:MAG: hypothetical protein ACK4WD_08125 [Flavobacteriales bacterium]|jgi:hypothetical protein